MILKDFSEIKTERLLLRAPQLSDWEMISYLRSDELINKFVNRKAAPTRIEAQKFINRIRQEILDHKIYYWSIIYRNEMIGSICLWNISIENETAEVGYDLATKFQKQGFMQEAMQAILHFGFDQLDLKVIEAFTHRENESSISMLRKNKFKLLAGKVDPDNQTNLIFYLFKPSI